MNSSREGKNDQGGFVGLILLIILALAALKYFLNWSIFDAAATSQGQSTIGYIRDLFNTIWSYISTPVAFIWDSILGPLLNLIWNSLQELLKMGKATGSQMR